MLSQKSSCFQLLLSQGSVATHLMCGVIFGDSAISNFLSILAVIKRLKIADIISLSNNVPIFGLPCRPIHNAGKKL